MILAIRLRARLSILLILLVLGGCFQSTPKSGLPSSTRYLPQEPEPVRKSSFVNLNSVIKDTDKPANLWEYFKNEDSITALTKSTSTRSNQAAIDSEIERITDNQHYFNLISENARPLLQYVIKELEKREMPLFLALVPAIESSYRSDVTSPWHAAGLWQFIPSTGKHFGLKQNRWYDGRRDVMASTQAALDYLQKLHGRFDDWQLALAAYNSGGRTVSNAIKKNEKHGKPTDYWSLDLPSETSSYIPKLIALNTVICNPTAYGISLLEIANEPAVTQVDIEGQIQLRKAAELANLDLQELKKLNAAHIRSVTAPEGPHKLLVPVDSAERLKLGISRLPESERVTMLNHTIKSGESLSTIAQKYGISVSLLKNMNNLSSSVIKTGKQLVVPTTPASTNSKQIASETSGSQSGGILPSLEDSKYQIKTGDSLWLIARRFDIHVQQILDWNNIDRDHPLIPGKELKILIQDPILKTASL